MSDRERLAEVLHARIDGDYLIDTGGYEADLPIRQCGPADVVRWALNALLASDALAQMLAEARAEALREAADVMPIAQPGQQWVGAADWLRRRARDAALTAAEATEAAR